MNQQPINPRWKFGVFAAFAVFAILGAWTAFLERGTDMNRVNYWYCSISSGLHLVVALYLAWFGVIGMQTWA